MEFALNTPSENQNKIVQRIIEGSLRLSSIDEFEQLLANFGDNPDIQREYADFLVQRKSVDAAYKAYNRAADLYIQTDKALQAIVAKIRAWSLVKPDHEQGRAFHTDIRRTASGTSALQTFFSELSYPEFIGIMLRMIRVRFPADQYIVNYGDPANDIYFIVSGTVEERMHKPAGKRGESPSTAVKFLSDNDIFGEIFPLEQFNVSPSDIKTVTAVELVKIKKPILTEVIKKHTGIQERLVSLYKGPSGNAKDRTWTSVRRSVRHEIPIKVHLTVSLQDEASELAAVGYTRDISLGGACLELTGQRWGALLQTVVDAEAILQIYLPNVDEILEIPGTVLWIKKEMQAEEEVPIIGIQFNKLSKADRDFLNEHCFGSDGEQNLIWDLWETYVK
jgi:CRP-like cAMP-binding protein